RNCFRFLLGNLSGFSDSEKSDLQELPELERYMLHRLSEVSDEVRAGYEGFDFRRVYQTLFNFMTVELSAFYFDIRKDALYCDPNDSPERRGCRTIMDITFDCLTSWLAPVLCFTTEEVWQSRFGETRGSIHEQQFPDIP
ncbi:MAG TPA: isoleucine--tRNA ligase, partial [Rhodobiaceae bacterium]|nr:isoleucine--tRNA ligase [Rhodobiaceae bacterium]